MSPHRYQCPHTCIPNVVTSPHMYQEMNLKIISTINAINIKSPKKGSFSWASKYCRGGAQTITEVEELRCHSKEKIIIKTFWQQCTMCCLGSMISSQPNKLRPVLKFVFWYPIQHIFVLACPIARKRYNFLCELQTLNRWFSQKYTPLSTWGQHNIPLYPKL